MPLRSHQQQREILDGLRLRENIFRYAIAGFVLLFGAIGLLALASVDGPRSSAARIVVVAVCLTTIPVSFAVTRLRLGSIWWPQRAQWQPAPTLFVVYADLGVTAVLAAFHDAGTALLCTALFAVVSAFAAHFLTALPRLLHVGFTSLVIIWFGVRATARGDVDLAGGIVRTAVLLLAVHGTVFLHSLYTSDIRHAIARNHIAATTDPLTMLANRRAFHVRATRLIDTAPHGVDILVVDVDHLKQLNDSHGHAHGDEILRRVAAGITNTFGLSAVSARLGGDEFAVAIAAEPGRTEDQLARTLCELLAEEGIDVSIGVARGSGSAAEQDSEAALSHLLKIADERMYAGKQRRRNGNVPPPQHHSDDAAGISDCQ